MTTELAPVLCSDNRVEPLPGTAKTGTIFVAFEHLHGWGRDIMDGDAFDSETTARLAAYLKQFGASLQLIRKPGREGQQRAGHTVFIAFVEHGIVEKLHVNSVAELLNLDISAPGTSGGERVPHPVVLVCTHGKRDMCCAVKGRPLAAALESEFGGDVVWESSHTKGHRFAPSIIALPWGYSFGHLGENAAADMVRHFQRGELFLAGNRGRSCYPAAEQAAELAVATRLVEHGEVVRLGALVVSGDVVSHNDGRQWEVVLEQRPVEGVISSCGDAPKAGKAWKIRAIVPRLH
ncbi:sucrase ferredoxin [Corynebacterium sp. H128]|uniref:sucrase ferredoxin n=1 Tax=Corynebacterium sp. H128 TaxID=3133427 RepID=UPI0030971433